MANLNYAWLLFRNSFRLLILFRFFYSEEDLVLCEEYWNTPSSFRCMMGCVVIMSLTSPTWKKHICTWCVGWDAQMYNREHSNQMVATVMFICSLFGFWGKSSPSPVVAIQCGRPRKHTNVCPKFIVSFNILSVKKNPTQLFFSEKYFIDADRVIPLVLICSWCRLEWGIWTHLAKADPKDTFSPAELKANTCNKSGLENIEH